MFYKNRKYLLNVVAKPSASSGLLRCIQSLPSVEKYGDAREASKKLMYVWEQAAPEHIFYQEALEMVAEIEKYCGEEVSNGAAIGLEIVKRNIIKHDQYKRTT